MKKATWKNCVRPLTDLGDCLGVSLSDGSVALIDYEDRKLAEGWNWTAEKSRNGVYAVRGSGTGKIRLHAAIAGAGSDHSNRNTLDNRRKNLRPATSAENARNRRPAKNNKSGFKGVSLRKDRGTWLACIRTGDRLTKIGTFSTPVEAAQAYDRVARELFGDFAYLNFPDGSAVAGERVAP